MFAVTGWATPQPWIGFQGRLTDGTGGPIGESVDLTVAFFDDSTDGQEVFSEGYVDVELHDGLFSLPLGSLASLDAVGFADPLWVEVTVAGDSPMVPRLPLNSAGTALLAVDALSVDGDPVQAAAFGVMGMASPMTRRPCRVG